VDLVVKVEQVPLGRGIAGKGAGKPLVQRPLGLFVARELAGVLPPVLKVAPPEAVTTDGPVVDEDLVRALKDLDVVADGVADPDVRLDLGGEHEILRLPVTRSADWNDAEYRVPAVAAGLAQLRSASRSCGLMTPTMARCAGSSGIRSAATSPSRNRPKRASPASNAPSCSNRSSAVQSPGLRSTCCSICPRRLAASRAKKPSWLSFTAHRLSMRAMNLSPLRVRTSRSRSRSRAISRLVRFGISGGTPAGPEHVLDRETSRRA
jgi:hypothetical protein